MPMLRCRQAAAAAAIAYVLFVVVVVVSITIAAAAFSRLLIVGSAPAIAVAAGVFVATVAVRGGSAAPADLLLPLMLQCHQILKWVSSISSLDLGIICTKLCTSKFMERIASTLR